MSRNKNRIVSLKYSHSKIWSAEVLASFHFSLSRCYLSTCGCTNKHVSHSSEHRGRPSNHHRPREAYVHIPTCVIVVTSRVISDRTLDRDQGQQSSSRRLPFEKRFSEIACLTMYLLFSRRHDDENPRENWTRDMREYYIRLYVESGDRRRRSRSLFYRVARSSTFLFYRTLINSRYARISFMIFVAQTPYVTVCERRLFFYRWFLLDSNVYISPFSEWLVFFERNISWRENFILA